MNTLSISTFLDRNIVITVINLAEEIQLLELC